MNAIDALLQQFDDAWAHAYESVVSVLDGVTAAEADWQSRAYVELPGEEGWPRPGTINWQVAHLAACKHGYAATLHRHARQQGPNLFELAITPTYMTNSVELQTAHLWMRSLLATLAPSDLPLPVHGRGTLIEFLGMTIRHDAWHAGQIAMTRRLYAARG